MIRSFNGKTPRVAESAYIDEAACIIGDVEIGENSGVFPGAVIRGDFARIRIGANTMIEDNSVIHSGAPLEIGEYVTVGHGVVVHGERIGNNNLIGNNATILDDSVIGSYCVIGAGCLVSRGMEIPDRSFVVGIPAEIKREISPQMLQRLQGGSQSYADLLRQYKREVV